MSNQKVTANERSFLLHILQSDFQDGNDPVGHWVWSDDLCDNHADAATLGSLVKKGLAMQDGKRREACCALTALGAEVIAAEVAEYRARNGIEK